MTSPGGRPYLPSIDLTACPKPITINGTSFATTLVTGPGLIIALTYSNNGATAAGSFTIRDGQSASGNILVTVKVPGGQGGSLAVAEPGIWFGDGLLFVSGGGAVTWTLTYLPYYSDPS